MAAGIAGDAQQRQRRQPTPSSCAAAHPGIPTTTPTRPRSAPPTPARDDTVKLGDFGIARALDGTHELASTVIGTPLFMSPELMQSRPYDYKSDIWSLGCCCFEMMALRHAFDATDMSTLVIKILQVGRGLGQLPRLLGWRLRRIQPRILVRAVCTGPMRWLRGSGACMCAGRPPAHPHGLQSRAEGLCEGGAEHQPSAAALHRPGEHVREHADLGPLLAAARLPPNQVAGWLGGSRGERDGC